MEDEEIIELFLARSEQGIRELDGKYGKACSRLSYNIVNNTQDAEECVNDAYLGAWNAIPPARPNTLLSYILKIVRNIVVSFNGEKEYLAIAQIEIEKVYRGTCSEGDTVSVLFPCPISAIMYATDSSTVSAMKAGMTGIFMPMVYDDETAMWLENGASLDQRELAEYGFADGERYAFLEKGSGLVFNRGAYASIADATTLDEVEEYIEKMLERLDGNEIK